MRDSAHARGGSTGLSQWTDHALGCGDDGARTGQLDEGLAEYFEIAPAKKSINLDHLKQLRQGPGGQLRVDLAKLEELTEVDQMKPPEYREAWAWVHLMLNGNDESRKVLTGYLKDLRSTKSPGSLRTRLMAVYPMPETALARHLAQIDQNSALAISSK